MWPFLSSIEQKCRYVHLLLCICIIQLFCEQHWTKMSISCGILSSLHLTCGQRKHPKLFNIKTICAQIQNSRKHVTKTTIAKALKNSDFLADWLTTRDFTCWHRQIQIQRPGMACELVWNCWHFRQLRVTLADQWLVMCSKKRNSWLYFFVIWDVKYIDEINL